MEEPNLVGAEPQESAAAGPQADTRPIYHLIRQVGATAEISYSEYRDRDALIVAIRDIYKSIAAGEANNNARVFIIEGTRVRIAGNPLRRLIFPDGSRMLLEEDDPEWCADDQLLSPAMRGIYITTPAETPPEGGLDD